MTKIVYRCENEDELGPYSRDASCLSKRRKLLDHHSYRDYWSHPSPWTDGISGDVYHKVCGFQTIGHLKKWFTKAERDALRALGWKFYVFEIADNHVLYGNHQCVFTRQKAKTIKELTEDDIAQSSVGMEEVQSNTTRSPDALRGVAATVRIGTD